MIRIVTSIALGTVALLTAPAASAAPRDDTAPAVVAPAAAPVAKTARYCFAEVQTGAILRRNVCDSRANWLRNGVEPLNYPAQ